uniref:NAD-dependent histone deacetylase SIR2 n=1 Tax=Ganoderma boninense TaxID=34458 RepID=A0A5K1JW25_9APHY|nr:NAD-dependent histone deacetylase SIR2 [Ganoderma boninense]
MPRDSTSGVDSTRKAQRVWGKAVTASLRPRGFASKPVPLCAKTAADVFVLSLLEDCGIEWGRGDTDIRRNIVLKLWVEEQKGDDSEPFEDHMTYTLKVKLEPGMFIRPSTVTLEAYTGGDIEAPSAPLWLQRLPRGTGSCPLEFTRVHTISGMRQRDRVLLIAFVPTLHDAL